MSTVFNHLGLSVHNLESEVDFYTKAFDMTEEFRFQIDEEKIEAVVLRSGDGWGIEIMSREGSTPRPAYDSPNGNLASQGYGHFCLRVDDIHETHQRLLAVGAREITPPAPAPHPAVTFSYLADPEGHFIELINIPAGVTL